MAEKRTINIDINSNASEAEKDFKSFNKAVNETTKSAKNLDATFEEVYGDLQPLTTRMGEAEDRLYELALAGDTASKEYQELLTKVGEYRKVQIQTDLAVDGAATTMTQKLGSALNGATSGFAATQGAMALFGDENQALEKSLLKVQSALAIQQGVQGLTEAYRELSIGTKIAAAGQAAFTFVTGAATTGLKLLRLALISTGIGAIVVAVGLLIANFDKLLIPLNAAKNALKSFGDAIGLTDFAEKERAAASKKRFDEENARIEKQKQNLEKRAEQEKLFTQVYLGELELRRRKAIQDGEDLQEVDAKIFLAKIFAINKEKKTFLDAKKLELKRLDNLLTRFKKNSAKYNWQVNYNAELRKRIKNEEYDEVKLFNQKIEALTLDDIDKDKEAQKTKNDNYKNYLAERLRIARQIEDIENGLLKDGIEKELEINRDKFRRLREDAKKNTKLTTEERATLIDLRNQEEAQAEAKIIADNQKRREDAFETEKSQRVELLNFVDELNTAEVESEKAKNLAIIESSKDAAAKQKEIDEKAAQEKADRQNAQIDLAVQGFQLIAGIAEAFAGEDVKRQKKAFQIKKVADIASATVDGYRAVLSTYAQTPGGPVIKGIAAGLAGSFAALQIANIAKQQFQGGGDGSDVAASADVGGGESVTPQFNVVGDSGINQIAQLQQQPVQAFVVSGEVTTSQALDRNRVQNATL